MTSLSPQPTTAKLVILGSGPDIKMTPQFRLYKYRRFHRRHIPGHPLVYPSVHAGRASSSGAEDRAELSSEDANPSGAEVRIDYPDYDNLAPRAGLDRIMEEGGLSPDLNTGSAQLESDNTHGRGIDYRVGTQVGVPYSYDGGGSNNGKEYTDLFSGGGTTFNSRTGVDRKLVKEACEARAAKMEQDLLESCAIYELETRSLSGVGDQDPLVADTNILSRETPGCLSDKNAVEFEGSHIEPIFSPISPSDLSNTSEHINPRQKNATDKPRDNVTFGMKEKSLPVTPGIETGPNAEKRTNIPKKDTESFITFERFPDDGAPISLLKSLLQTTQERTFVPGSPTKQIEQETPMAGLSASGFIDREPETSQATATPTAGANTSASCGNLVAHTNISSKPPPETPGIVVTPSTPKYAPAQLSITQPAGNPHGEKRIISLTEKCDNYEKETYNIVSEKYRMCDKHDAPPPLNNTVNDEQWVGLTSSSASRDIVMSSPPYVASSGGMNHLEMLRKGLIEGAAATTSTWERAHEKTIDDHGSSSATSGNQPATITATNVATPATSSPPTAATDWLITTSKTAPATIAVSSTVSLPLHDHNRTQVTSPEVTVHEDIEDSWGDYAVPFASPKGFQSKDISASPTEVHSNNILASSREVQSKETTKSQKYNCHIEKSNTAVFRLILDNKEAAFPDARPDSLVESHYKVISEFNDKTQQRTTTAKLAETQFVETGVLRQQSEAQRNEDPIYAIPIPKSQRKPGSDNVKSPDHFSPPSSKAELPFKPPRSPLTFTPEVHSEDDIDAFDNDAFPITCHLKKSVTTGMLRSISDSNYSNVPRFGKYDWFSLGRRPRCPTTKTLRDSKGMALSLDMLLRLRKHSSPDISNMAGPEPDVSVDDILKSCSEFEQSCAAYRSRASSDSTHVSSLQPFTFAEVAHLKLRAFDVKDKRKNSVQAVSPTKSILKKNGSTRRGSEPSPSITDDYVAAIEGHVTSRDGYVTSHADQLSPSADHTITSPGHVTSTAGHVISYGHVTTSVDPVISSGHMTTSPGHVSSVDPVTFPGHVTTFAGHVANSAAGVVSAGHVTSPGHVTSLAAHMISSGHVTTSAGYVASPGHVASTANRVTTSAGHVTFSTDHMTSPGLVTSSPDHVTTSAGHVTSPRHMAFSTSHITSPSHVTHHVDHVNKSEVNAAAPKETSALTTLSCPTSGPSTPRNDNHMSPDSTLTSSASGADNTHGETHESHFHLAKCQPQTLLEPTTQGENFEGISYVLPHTYPNLKLSERFPTKDQTVATTTPPGNVVCSRDFMKQNPDYDSIDEVWASASQTLPTTHEAAYSANVKQSSHLWNKPNSKQAEDINQMVSSKDPDVDGAVPPSPKQTQCGILAQSCILKSEDVITQKSAVTFSANSPATYQLSQISSENLGESPSNHVPVTLTLDNFSDTDIRDVTLSETSSQSLTNVSPDSAEDGAAGLMSSLSVDVLLRVAPADSQTVSEASTNINAELEAAEAVKWLRAAGFPQYAQMFEDGQFPVDPSVVEKDHDFLDGDSIKSLFRRLETLNKCAGMKIEVSADRKGTDEDEDDFCALSERWEYEKSARRWSRKETSSNRQDQGMGSDSTSPEDHSNSHHSLLASQNHETGSHSLIVAKNTSGYTRYHGNKEGRQLSPTNPSVTEKNEDGTAVAVSPFVTHSSEKKVKTQKKLFKKKEGSKLKKSRRKKLEISGPIVEDNEMMRARLQRLNCVDISPKSEGPGFPEVKQPGNSNRGLFEGSKPIQTSHVNSSPPSSSQSPTSTKQISDDVTSPSNTSSSLTSPTSQSTVSGTSTSNDSPNGQISSFHERGHVQPTFLNKNLQVDENSRTNIKSDGTGLIEIFLLPRDHRPGQFPRVLQNGYIKAETRGTASSLSPVSVGTDMTSHNLQYTTLPLESPVRFSDHRKSMYDNFTSDDSNGRDLMIFPGIIALGENERNDQCSIKDFEVLRSSEMERYESKKNEFTQNSNSKYDQKDSRSIPLDKSVGGPRNRIGGWKSKGELSESSFDSISSSPTPRDSSHSRDGEISSSDSGSLTISSCELSSSMSKATGQSSSLDFQRSREHVDGSDSDSTSRGTLQQDYDEFDVILQELYQNIDELTNYIGGDKQELTSVSHDPNTLRFFGILDLDHENSLSGAESSNTIESTSEGHDLALTDLSCDGSLDQLTDVSVDRGDSGFEHTPIGTSCEHRRKKIRWHSFQKSHRPDVHIRDMQINSLTAGQLVRLQKLSLLRLTSIMEKYLPASRSGWNWLMPRFMKRQRSPDFVGRKVFGVPLTVMARRTGQPLPQCVLYAMRYLRRSCPSAVGIFRKSGVKSKIQQLRDEMEARPGITDFEDANAYNVADMLKTYFRDLPECLLTNKMSEIFRTIYMSVPESLQLEAIQTALMLLPDENREVLQSMLLFLSDIASHEADHQMNASNLAVCFAPTVFQLSSRQGLAGSPKRGHKNATGVPDPREILEQKAAHECLLMMIRESRRLFTVPTNLFHQLQVQSLAHTGPVSLEDIGHSPSDIRAFGQDRIQLVLKEAHDKNRGWVQTMLDGEVELFQRKPMDGCPLKEWKLVIDVEAPPIEVLHRLMNERHVWDDDMVSWSVVDRMNPHSDIFQFVLNSMAPHPYRHFCVLRYWRSDLTKGACTLITMSVQHPDVTEIQGLWAVDMGSYFLMEPCGSGRSRLTYITRIDTRGRTPEWYTKIFSYNCANFLVRLKESFRQDASGPETKV